MITSTVAVAITLALTVAVSLRSHIASAQGSRLRGVAQQLARWAARRLGDPGTCSRYEEEWAANIDAVPDPLASLLSAVGYLIAIPRMRRAVRPVRTAAQPGLGAYEHPIAAEELIRRFLTTASPAAFRLATLLAAVPVTLPIAQFVQARYVPEAGPEQLAELLTSGLLRRRSDSPGNRDENPVLFDIPSSVRAVLLSGARRSEVVQVIFDSAMFREGLPDERDSVQACRETPRSRAGCEPLPLFAFGQIRQIHTLLVGVADPRLPALAGRAAGLSVPPAPDGADAWAVFSHLLQYCTRPDGFPPALVFLDLLARHVGGEWGADLTAWHDTQARRLGLTLGPTT
ncbi:hypothetical protein ACFQ1S_00145 [Kibdelosporangium lantanae]|uniref:vWA-MoxR associated protein middle region 0 domain-containing protein n=1 Tax=Kibdelosporangium lantanae TaxID=1497396 RepID=A0ABW3M087_9PSEU